MLALALDKQKGQGEASPLAQGSSEVMELYRRQLNLAEGLIAGEVGDLWKDWMRHVDDVLDDPELLDLVYTTLATRWPN